MTTRTSGGIPPTKMEQHLDSSIESWGRDLLDAGFSAANMPSVENWAVPKVETTRGTHTSCYILESPLVNIWVPCAVKKWVNATLGNIHSVWPTPEDFLTVPHIPSTTIVTDLKCVVLLPVYPMIRTLG